MTEINKWRARGVVERWSRQAAMTAGGQNVHLYYAREAYGVTELHVDDGHGCGKETIVAELLAFLSEKIKMKYVQGIWSGSYKYLKTMRVRDEKKLTSIPNKKHLQSALNKLEMRLQGECFSQIGTRRSSMVTARNLMRDRRQGSDPPCLLCCISATKERTSKARYGCCARS